MSLNKKEHFGIAIAEGMNFGCVPVVPENGGQWIDIVDKGKYGIGFVEVYELRNAILKSFEYGVNERNKIMRSVDRFSFEVFETRLKETLSKINAIRN